MKTMIRLLSLAALATACTLPAFAQATPAAPAAQNLCEEQARTDLYTNYYNKKKGDAAAQKEAYELAKQFVAKYESCNDKYVEATKKYISVYEQALGSFNLQSKLAKAYEEKRWADATAAAKEILAKNPDDVKTVVEGAWSAYQGVVAKNPALTADAQNLAQQALQLIQSGKPSDSYFFPSKDEAQYWMEYLLGALSIKNNPTEATKHLIVVAQSSTAAKQEPTTYYYLAQAYTDEWQKLTAKYNTIKEVNDESKLLLANINQSIDRIIDAYARAVAFSTTPDQQAKKAEWMKTLTELYKSRHNDSEAGLNEMLASIKTTPLLLTEPITTLPAETPAGATGGDGATGTKPPMTATPTTTAPPTAAQPMTTQPKPAQPTPTATPKPLPPKTKPPVKRHHD